MIWLIFLMTILYIMMGIGAASGARYVKGKIGYFEAVFDIIFWPAVLLTLIIIKLGKD